MSVLRKSPLPPPEKDNENEDAKDSDIEDSGFFLTTLLDVTAAAGTSTGAAKSPKLDGRFYI